MKALNTVKFISNATTEYNEWMRAIKEAEDYETAKNKARCAFGYIDCMIVFLNTMIDKENNDFTADLDEMIDEWKSNVYQNVADKAIEMKEAPEEIMKMLQKRDEYRDVA